MKKKQVVASLLVAVSVLGTSPLAALAEEGKVTSPVDVVVPSPSDNEKVPVPTEKEEKPKDDKTQTGEVTPETPVNPTIPDNSGEIRNRSNQANLPQNQLSHQLSLQRMKKSLQKLLRRMRLQNRLLLHQRKRKQKKIQVLKRPILQNKPMLRKNKLSSNQL